MPLFDFCESAYRCLGISLYGAACHCGNLSYCKLHLCFVFQVKSATLPEICFGAGRGAPEITHSLSESAKLAIFFELFTIYPGKSDILPVYLCLRGVVLTIFLLRNRKICGKTVTLHFRYNLMS